MDLYTDMMHHKLVMRGEASPAWTPVTVDAMKIIDPDFVPGMGALCEDDQGRLRCPVNGCGRWFHLLSTHLSSAHAEIGGAMSIRRALSIPPSVALASFYFRGKCSMGGKLRKDLPRFSRGARDQRKSAASHSAARHTVAYRNKQDTCDAQTAHKIMTLAAELGRTPSGREFRKRYGRGMSAAVYRVYGSWSNALALCDLRVGKSGRKPGCIATHTLTSAHVLPALEAWYQVHGELPSAADARNRIRVPAIPSAPVIKRLLGANEWGKAMRAAASLLDIRGGRYGLPVEEKAVA